jgi:F-type H+-transporting ATPase subunit b
MEYEALSSSPWAHGAFWVLVAILIFVVLFGAKIVVPLGRLLDNRADAVRRSLDEAAQLKAEAEALLVDARKKRTQALAEAKDILARAREEAARTAAELTAEAEMRAHARERMVEERIQSAQASAIAEVRSTAVEVAIAATTQALREGLTAADDARLVDHAIGEVPGAFSRRAA